MTYMTYEKSIIHAFGRVSNEIDLLRCVRKNKHRKRTEKSAMSKKHNELRALVVSSRLPRRTRKNSDDIITYIINS